MSVAVAEMVQRALSAEGVAVHARPLPGGRGFIGGQVPPPPSGQEGPVQPHAPGGDAEDEEEEDVPLPPNMSLKEVRGPVRM